MGSYKHLTIEERERILAKLNQGASQGEIARELGRSKSTISREMKRNSATKETYSAAKCTRNYMERRKKSVRRVKLACEKLRSTVEKLLHKYWSPEEISGRMAREKSEMQISTGTIYRGIERGLIDKSCKQKLRHKGRHRCGGRGKSRCGHLNIDHRIHDRPKNVESRKRVGHWESDTVRGANNSGCIATHVERKSRYVLMRKMPNRTATAMTEATISAFESIGTQKCLSITPDHGKEFSKHREIATALNCKVYFADAGSPWQRGTNENTNGLIRQFFPKRTSFKDVTQADLDSVNELLNKRPRKCLAWKTPFEVFFNKQLHFI